MNDEGDEEREVRSPPKWSAAPEDGASAGKKKRPRNVWAAATLLPTIAARTSRRESNFSVCAWSYWPVSLCRRD